MHETSCNFSQLAWPDPACIAPFLPEEPDSNLFYVAKIARSCGPDGGKAEYCLEVPSSGYLSVPLDEYIFIMNRAYLEPETGCEPAADEILEALILRVKPRR